MSCSEVTVAGDRVSPKMPAITRHIPALDGLRGIAILGVLALHFFQVQYGTLVTHGHLRSAKILGRFADPGQYGVDLFFVLSGFLITGILLDTRSDRRAMFNFYMRRFLRIFPLTYAALAILLLVLPHFIAFDAGARDIERHQIWLWTYLADWPWGNERWDSSNLFLLGHLWTLSVEEQFYIIWPMMVFWLPQRSIGRVCLVLLGAGMLARAANFYGGPVIFQWSLLCRMDGLPVGALIAIAARNGSLERFLPDPRKFKIALCALSSGFVVQQLLPKKFSFAPVSILGPTITVAFFGLVVMSALRLGKGSAGERVLTSKILMKFGKYSYGIYVIHGIIRPTFARFADMDLLPGPMRDPLLFIVLYYAFAIGVSFILAWLSYQLFEKHFLKLKKYFDSGPKTA